MPIIVSDSTSLNELLERISPIAPVCAIDTEADSLHRYKESLCLIQLSAGGENVLIDPLAISDIAPFGKYLNRSEVWMHGADYDMTMIKREFGTLPPKVWDTQIGARLLGLRKFGLSDLVEHWFGVVLLKTSQKADWGRRPMTDKMTEYAINDVVYLLPMAECIVEELLDKGRYDWFVQSCEAARKKVLERDDNKDDLWRINGSGRLPSRALAYLKSLWEWRDAEAASWDKPSFMVVNNKEMLVWAETLGSGETLDLPRHLQRPDRLRRFEKYIAEAKALSDEECPHKIKVPRRKKDAAFEKEVDKIIQKRDQASSALDIDPSLVIARSVAESIAAGEVSPSDVLLPWQREQLQIEG
jgi:ribonuclease D